MPRHKIGTYAGGVAGMQSMCTLLKSGREPRSTPVEYEVVGNDLTGIPIEAGFGSALWDFGDLPQEDYEFLLALQTDVGGKQMYVHTSKRSGYGGIDYDDFLCVAKRPTFDSRLGLTCYGVKMEITMMEAA